MRSAPEERREAAGEEAEAVAEEAAVPGKRALPRLAASPEGARTVASASPGTQSRGPWATNLPLEAAEQEQQAVAAGNPTAGTELAVGAVATEKKAWLVLAAAAR
jgi:hypothetical protein